VIIIYIETGENVEAATK